MTNTNAKPIDWRAHAALLWVQIIFGIFPVFGKYILTYLHPLALAGLRVLGATPILMLLAWRFEHFVPTRRDLPILAGLGMLGIFANQIFYIFGLKYTSATNAAILMPVIPVFTLAIAMLFRVEKVSLALVLGVSLSVLGALVMVGPFGFSLAEGNSFGNMLLILNCAAYAGYLVWQRPLLERMPPFTVTAYAFLFGGAASLLVATPYVISIDWSGTPSLVWWGVAYSIVLQTALNYAINMWAMRRSTPTVVSSYITLQPLTAAILATVFLGEQIVLRDVTGFALITGGLVVVTWGARRAANLQPTDAR